MEFRNSALVALGGEPVETDNTEDREVDQFGSIEKILFLFVLLSYFFIISHCSDNRPV